MLPRLLAVVPAPDDQQYLAEIASAPFQLSLSASMAAAVKHIVATPPDAILSLLPEPDAHQFCEVVRALGDVALIVARPALPTEMAVRCLDAGADAVLDLPLPAGVLTARIDAVMRRCAEARAPQPATRIRLQSIEIDTAARQVFRDGLPVELSPKEFALLRVLAEEVGRVVTTRELLARVWGSDFLDDAHYVRLYIGYLRQKLERDPRQPRLLLTQWGVGYRLAT